MSRGRVLAGNRLSVAHDDAASRPGAARTARRHALRTVGVGVVDDERASVPIEQRQRPLRETDPAADRSEQTAAPVADLKVDEISGMKRVVAVGVRVAVRSRIRMPACCRTRLTIGGLVDLDCMIARQEAGPDANHDVHLLDSLCGRPLPKVGQVHRAAGVAAGPQVRPSDNRALPGRRRGTGLVLRKAAARNSKERRRRTGTGGRDSRTRHILLWELFRA